MENNGGFELLIYFIKSIYVIIRFRSDIKRGNLKLGVDNVVISSLTPTECLSF